MINLPKIVAIVGPTASGKSVLAVEIAKKFDGEVVSADSRQFYRGMDIGTGKVKPTEMQGVPHHLIDFLTPDQPTNVYEFQKMAFGAIEDILSRGKLPILVGGTGLFVAAVIENYNLSSAPVDEELRGELHKLDLGELQKRLLEFDPHTTIDIKNPRRVVRQLEYFLLDPKYKAGTNEPRYEVLILEPYYDRDELYKKINKRVKNMFSNGLPDEVKNLANKYGFDAHGLNAIGYREFQKFNNQNLDDIMEEVKKNSRNYAKRQATWFRRYKNKITVKNLDQASIEVQKFLT